MILDFVFWGSNRKWSRNGLRIGLPGKRSLIYEAVLEPEPFVKVPGLTLVEKRSKIDQNQNQYFSFPIAVLVSKVLGSRGLVVTSQLARSKRSWNTKSGAQSCRMRLATFGRSNATATLTRALAVYNQGLGRSPKSFIFGV